MLSSHPPTWPICNSVTNKYTHMERERYWHIRTDWPPGKSSIRTIPSCMIKGRFLLLCANSSHSQVRAVVVYENKQYPVCCFFWRIKNRRRKSHRNVLRSIYCYASYIGDNASMHTCTGYLSPVILITPRWPSACTTIYMYVTLICYFICDVYIASGCTLWPWIKTSTPFSWYVMFWLINDLGMYMI